MAIKGSFYAENSNDRPYYYYDFNANFKDVFTNGIATRGAALSTEMQVSAVSATMKSQVALGIAYVEGIRSEIYTAAEEVTHSTADVSNPRIDIVALEVNTKSAVRNSRIVIVEGTPAASPSAPSLTTDSDQYQMSLAEVLIPANETDADNFTYTDTRVLAANPTYPDIGWTLLDNVSFSGTESKTINSTSGYHELLIEVTQAVGTTYNARGAVVMPLNSSGVSDGGSTVVCMDGSGGYTLSPVGLKITTTTNLNISTYSGFSYTTLAAVRIWAR